MISVGLTYNTRESAIDRLRKKTRTIFACFFIACLLPFFVWLLFRFNLASSTPAFSVDIQQPVAKLLTPKSVGTAFLVSPTKLLTARHVLDGMKVGDKVRLFFERTAQPREVMATILHIAPQSSTRTAIDGKVTLDYFLDDAAVLEIPSLTDIAPLDLGSSDLVGVLDEVILIGYPSGDYSITKGSINSDKYQGLDLFKLDAASNPGNSGGPCILKEDNTVIGILVGGSGPGAQGENVAIKIDKVKELMRRKGIDLSK